MGRQVPTVVVGAFLVVTLTVPGCSGGDDPLVRQQATDIKRLLASAPASVSRDRDRVALWKTMRSLYGSREHRPIWIKRTHPASQFGELLAALQEAESHGIDPQRYDLEGLTEAHRRSRKGWMRRDEVDVKEVAPLDLRATWAWIQYAADLSAGAVDVEGPADKLWRLRRRKIDFAKRLAASIEGDSIVEDLRMFAPQHSEYSRLMEAHARYLSIARSGGWRTLPPRLTLKPGETSPHVGALAARLAATNDLAGSKWFEKVRGGSKGFEEVRVFDAELSAAVARFQRRHGLEADGSVGPRVVAEMNIPVDRRIRQIELNLERWRWLPRDLGDRYIFVNVPEYRLEIHEGDGIPLSMNVIVGAKSTPTPVFSDTLTHVVFSPYWNVPDSIAWGETLPAVQADPAFLERNGIEVVGTTGRVVDSGSIDWSSLSADEGALPYRFRQRPGSSNSLGLVKFVFPNEYDVYLHDTPADSLFRRAYRAMSHGCVRVEQPQALAEYLLKDQAEWTPDSIRAAMQAGEEKHVKLTRPVPVHLMYWTARVHEDGTVQFREDVYGRDAREIGALMARLKAAGPRGGG